jgi:hypothetical protein
VLGAASAGATMTAASSFAAPETGARLAGCSDFKLTPAELREQARVCMEASRKDVDPQIRRVLAGAAFTLAQLGECIERLNAAE